MKQAIGQSIWAFDENGNVLVSPTKNSEFPEDLAINIVQGFHWACKSGPLCQQPLRGIKVTLEQVDFDSNPNNRESSQVMHAISRGVLGSFLTGRPVFMEAIYKIEMTSPVQLFGACTNMIIRRRGKIHSTDQKAGLAIINGTIQSPRHLAWPQEFRSTTSGRASWQLSFDRWEKTPEKLATEIIKRFRERIGLPPKFRDPRYLLMRYAAERHSFSSANR